jgi:hypothetical protein
MTDLLNKREIKFNGWHVGANKMFSAEEMAADQLTLLPTGSFINVNGTSTALSTIYPSDKFIPLQFANEYYSDGTEVYEGDIYEYEYEYDSDYDGDMPIVKKSKGKGVVESIYNTRDIRTAKYEGGKVNKIGNIYQNPDLLKP